ncbi:CCAAT/enhancer-binding protein beta-like [Branchiostoma floridae]|uniref:CCAAT/enhancer-binding protein gamma n=1 Tax=Branchiostoma floridae TaxID=7739 RepID=A0A9J7L996_BRAFL|nr:CCAAT/enhancer-binding protein beta-like [Branchiostoma floridae]
MADIDVKSEPTDSSDSSPGSPPVLSPGTSSGGRRGGGKASKKYLHDKNSDEYRKRRERNNLAVKKSRDKSRQKTQETLRRVQELKEENERLELKIKILSKELSVLKDLFLSHAGSLPGEDAPCLLGGVTAAPLPMSTPAEETKSSSTATSTSNISLSNGTINATVREVAGILQGLAVPVRANNQAVLNDHEYATTVKS